MLVTPDGLDLNLPGTGKAVLPAHHYKAMLDEDQEMAYTFQTGIDLDAYGGVIGSFVYENNGKMEYVMVEDGTVDITLDGSTYTVDAVVKSGGKEYKFRYTGAIEVETNTDGGDGGWTTVNVGKLTQARFEYYGDEYSTNGVSDNWIMYLLLCMAPLELTGRRASACRARPVTAYRFADRVHRIDGAE